MKATDLIKMLQQRYNLLIVEPLVEKDTFYISAESKDGLKLFDYWSEDNENRTFGIDNSFIKMLEDVNAFVEWVDSGTIIVTTE